MLRLLAHAGFPDVRLLTRNPASLGSFTLPRGWRQVVGDLSDPAPWSVQLREVETVVHLAAATGRASRKQHFAINLEATRRLLDEAGRAGVRRFLYVSSIAVTYPDRPHYHYAESKAAAEALFLSCRMDWLIVRPTLVLGPGSPLLASLRRLAQLPVPLLFGPGTARVQPIHVEDLAELLVAALALPSWEGRVLTAAGPEAVTVEELFRMIRSSAKARRVRFVHLPLRPVRGLLALLEPVLRRALPFTAGQLAFFANSSTTEPGAVVDALPAPRRGLDAMLEGTNPA